MRMTPPITPRAGFGARLGAGVLALALLLVLAVGAWLSPSTKGFGSHTALGMPPCGWVVAFGKPCPTCGMTTAFAHAARLELWEAAKVQPMGCLLALMAATMFWPAAFVAATGSRVGQVYATLFGPRTLWTLVALGVAAWAYKFVTWPG